MRLSFQRVTSWGEAETLRAVRNSCKEGMTAVTTDISTDEQWQFWRARLLTEDFEAYLLMDHEQWNHREDVAMGYALLHADHISIRGCDIDDPSAARSYIGRTYDEDMMWMTAGLAPAARGKGLSRFIIATITEMAYASGRAPWIEVYDWNLALINDVRVGYRYVDSREGDRGRILIMRHKHDRETQEGYEGIPGYQRPTGVTGQLATRDS